MIISPFKKFVGALLVTTSLVACNKDDGGKNGDAGTLNPLNVTAANLTGAWEVDGHLVNDQPAQLSSVSGEKLQYEISENTITAIVSREGQVTAEYSATYTIQNNRIVTQDTERNSMQDLDIVKLTASTMRIRPIPQQGQGDLNLTLKRIDPSLLVGGSRQVPPGDDNEPQKPWKEEFIQLDMVTPTLKFTKTYYGKTQGDGTPGPGRNSELSCRYDRRSKEFNLELRSYGRNQERDERNMEAYVSVSGIADFDLKSRYEVINFDILAPRREQRPGFVATFNPQRSQKIYFAMTRTSRCGVTLKREGRFIQFAGSCRGLDAAGDRIEGRSSVDLKGSCSLGRD